MLFRLLALLCLIAAPVHAQTPTPTPPKPNFVMILVDDFDETLMPRDGDAIVNNMPHLRQMMRDGVSFRNYFVADSLCCPSRASILTGMLPHNTGVRANTGNDGGLAAFTANGNEAKTFALPLQANGYRTGYMGKYINGQKATSPIPPGWNEWVSTNSYDGYNYTINRNGVVSSPPDYFTDLISQLGRDFIAAGPGPFYLQLAPFAPHAPYTPPTRYAEMFLDAVRPQTPAYDFRPEPSAPAWLRGLPPLTAATKAKMDRAFVLRVQSTKAIDDMIGAVRAQLVALGIADNTYVIFTSDNGMHFGEFSQGGGKQSPFDTDIGVPFVIVGPGIIPGNKPARLVQNIDIMPTILDLADLPPSPTVDGRSMFSTPFRSMAVVEHARPVYDIDDPDAVEPLAGDPPSYTALRGHGWAFVAYATGEVSYYDLIADPHQLHNIAASLTPARLAELQAAVVANTTCAGAVQCGAAQNLP